jgi:hypothetical protein
VPTWEHCLDSASWKISVSPSSAVREKDRNFVAALLDAGLVDAGVILERLARVLSVILHMAVKDGRLARDVATGVNLPRPTKAEQRFLTHAQVEALPKAVRPPDGCEQASPAR